MSRDLAPCGAAIYAAGQRITQAELASHSVVARELIPQIETPKKQGSVATLDRLARALSGASAISLK